MDRKRQSNDRQARNRIQVLNRIIERAALEQRLVDVREGAAEQNGVAVRTGAGDRSGTRQQHEQEALQQGHLAVSSILRDWIKGQITAVECGILSFEAVFMPHMLTNDGRPLLERVQELLPKADEPKVVQIPHKPDAA